MVLVNNRDKVDWFDGMTVSDVLKALGYNYVLITVTVDGVYVDPDDYEAKKVPDNADVKAIHIAHGG